MATSRKKAINPLIYSILDSPAFGGAEQYLLSNLSYLSQQGYPICLATNNQKVKAQFELEIKSKQLKHFTIIQFPFVLDAIGNWKGLLKFFFWSPFAVFWQAQTFWNLKKQHEHIICYWAGFSDRLLLSAIAKLFSTKIIWIEIGPLEPTFKKTLGFPKLMYSLTQNLPTQLITTSLWTKQSIVKNSNILSENISLVYPGVSFPSINEVKKYKRDGIKWRTQHHLDKKMLISFVGRMARENEIDVLLKGLKYFHDYFHQTINLVLVGDGPEKTYFQSLSKSLKISNIVIFTGFVSQQEKLSAVASSDIFVFARAWDLDGFGMTTLEGMSMAVPVITTDFGPQREIIIDQQNGLRFKPHDPIDLAIKIHTLITHPTLRTKLATAGRKSLSPTFTEETMHEATLRVIQEVQNK